MNNRKLIVWIGAIVGAGLVGYCVVIILANYGIDLVL